MGSVKKPGEAEEPRSEGSEKSTRDENDATKRREAANLAAAQSMADSAIKMLSLTFAQIVVGILGIIGLGATIHYSRKTAQAAIAATNLAKETTAIQLRAYVTLDRINTDCIEIVENLAGVSFVPVWKNSGATPARNVQYYTVCDYSRNGHPQKRDFPILGVSQNRTIIGPGIDELGPATEDIPDPLLLALARGNHSICIYGAIDYTDFQDVKRRTEFCAMIFLKEGTSGQPPFRFTKTAAHNGADEDCMREPYATAASPLRNPPFRPAETSNTVTEP